MKKIINITIISFLLLVALVSTGFSSPPKYIIGVENISYLPYYTIKDNQYLGLIPEILDAFAQKNNCRFIYRPLPIKRLHKNFLKGDVDFLYPDNPDWIKTQKKDIAIIYSKPIVVVIDGVMVLPEHKGRSVEYLKVLGTIRGYATPAYEAPLQAKRLFLYESTDYKGLLQMAIANRVDGAYVSINSALYCLREELRQPNALEFDATLPYDYAKHLLSTIKHPEIIELFDEFLETEKDLIDMLKKKYKYQEDPGK